MYMSHIGKQWVCNYNNKNNSNLSVRKYFEKEFFPLFYDHKNYLQSPANTPLFQLIAQRNTDNADAREEKKQLIIEKIENYVNSKNTNPEMSFAIGFPSADHLGTTSGQVTSLKLPLEEDDIYASWIGAGFGIGLRGGFNILIDNEKVLNAIEEGWKLYRIFVNENENIANKIETWNSKWLRHRFSDNYNSDNPREFFQPLQISKDGKKLIERDSWIEIIFSLSQALPEEILNGYVYNLGQMNKTIGFIQLRLPDIKKIAELYSMLFEKQTGISNKKLAAVYQTQHTFSTACERYSIIGLKSIEPKDLKKYMPGFSDKKLPKLKEDESSIINYTIYQTWIIAMLDNKQLLHLADQTASHLRQFVKAEKQTKTRPDRLVENLLNSRNRKNFIDNVIQIIKEDNDFYDIGNDLVNKIMLDIAPDNISLFVTLLRFKYLAK